MQPRPHGATLAPMSPPLTMLLALLSCGGGADDTGGPKRETRPIDARDDQPDTVVMVIVDTLARRHVQPWQQEWQTTPELAAFFEDAVVLADTQVVRGLTSVSVSSIASGVYPRFHGVRNNREWDSPWNPILTEMFQGAGYTTLGYSANTCQFIDRGVDERFCTWNWEVPDTYETQVARDQALITELSASLQARGADEKLFIWLHLINPHDPFNPEQDWYSQFHPEDYTGELDPEDPLQLDQWILEEHPITEEEQRHLDAVYASQVREMDRQLGELFDTLAEVGRWDDSVVMITADHGEELGAHHSYFYHGCSAYQQTMQVASAIRAPGRLPAGLWIDTPISSTDLAPTLADLSGIGWEGYRDGETLLAQLQAGAVEERPIYFERALSTAGVVHQGHRYILDLNEGFDECKPFDLTDLAFPGEYEELYDHASDPEEQIDLADSEPELLADMRELTCTWITSDVWYSEDADETHPMVTTCRQVLGIEVEADDGGGCSATGRAGAAGLAVWGGLLGLLRRRRSP